MTLRTTLLLLCCWFQSGCITTRFWEPYRPLTESHEGAFVDAALAPEDPSGLLLRFAFADRDTQIVRVTPPHQALERLGPETPMPASARPLTAKPLTLGGCELLLQADGRLEISGADWEWRLPSSAGGRRATELRGIWLLPAPSEAQVLVRLAFGPEEHLVCLRDDAAALVRGKEPARAPFPLAAELIEREEGAALRIRGATRVLLAPERHDTGPDRLALAGRIPFSVVTVACDALTLYFQLPYLIFHAVALSQGGSAG